MGKYRGSVLVRAGFLGIVLIALVIIVGLRPEQLIQMATSVQRHAVFTEAGGLAVGNDVKVSGVRMGAVTGVSLERGKVLVSFTLDSDVKLGRDTTAHIRTGTLLGERMLTIEPAGSGDLAAGQTIALSHTSSPYSLTDAVSEFTSNTAGTDTAALNQSLDTLSDTIDRLAPQIAPTFDGLTRLSESINGRNDTLRSLLTSAADVTGVLSDRSAQVNMLLLNANELMGVLNDRRGAIVDLLANTSAVAKQLTGLVHDNEQELAPTLEKLNSISEMLQRNRDNIAKALEGLAKYQVTQGEAVNNGYYYNAFVGNLIPSQALQPFLDYAFGFRRGDDTSPRAEFPFPYNGIPGGTR